MTGRAGGARRVFGFVALLSAAFTTYGSLVPFDFRAVPFDDAVAEFRSAMTHRLRPAGRSDPVVNVLLGVPLGFGLLGACRAGRTGLVGDLACGLALMPACAALAAAVEFGQVYLPTRFTSGADVWCQTLGSAVGMVGWVVVGRAVARPVGAVWERFERGGPAGRLLPGYVLLLATIQALPLDLDRSPRDVLRHLRDPGTYTPLAEFEGADADETWRVAGGLVRLAGLFFPAGLLAAHLRGRAGTNGVAVLVGAALVAFGTEAVQLGIVSRFPSMTDALTGTAGAMAGWAVGRLCRRGVGLEAGLVLGQVWLAVLLVGYWEPFRFGGPPAAFDWAVRASVEAGGNAFVLQYALTKLILFAPLGVVAAAAGARPGGVGRLLVAAAVG
ncbi:MAG: VanZ family protein, partial [Gemmataceae bacterium]|nr:VanZ family protein [Gemmataceae bacterium]